MFPQSRYYGWVQQGDFWLCQDPLASPSMSTQACSRIYWTFYLWPRFLKEIAELLKEIQVLPPLEPPRPGPDPAPYLIAELIPLLLNSYLGDPNPQPSIFVKSRLEITVLFRDALKASVSRLDKEIEALRNLPG